MTGRVALVLTMALVAGCGEGRPTSEAVLAGAIEKLGPGYPMAMHATGTINHASELQGSRPGASDQSPMEETLAWHPSGQLAHEVVVDRLEGTQDWVREVYDVGTKTIHIMADSFSVQLTDHPEVSGMERLRRRFPRLLLHEVAAADAVTVLSHLNNDAVIRAVLNEDTTLDLHIGSDSLLHRVDYTADFPARGVTTVRWEFEDYRGEGGDLFPHRYSIVIDDVPFTEMDVQWLSDDLSLLTTLVESPPGFEEPRAVNGSGGPAVDAAVDTLGGGLYRVTRLRSGFHPAFIEFSDFVVVMEAPAGYPLMLELPAGDVAPGPTPDWLSRTFRELVRETVGDKPIQHVVLTHFHNDHAGGVTAFLDTGVTVHAPPGDTAAIRSHLVAEGQGAVQLSGIETVERITDGTRVLDIIQLGPNPHTHEMLVAFLHDPSTLMVNDLVPGVTAEQLSGTELSPSGAFFKGWLNRSPLEPERLLTIHGTEVVELGPPTGR